MITLAMDASTYRASVAVLDQARVLATASVTMRGADDERLMPAIADVMQEAGTDVSSLARIVCGEGPGSFTSLRIAASIAKGLAFGGGVPLFAVSSLALLAVSTDATAHEGRFVAAIDALRGEHYVATCDVNTAGHLTAIGAVERWPSDSLAMRAEPIGLLVGAGLTIDAAPGVAGLGRLGAMLGARPAVDLAAWEPAYGRLAEAQVKWEAAHGRPLPAS
ncbi:MAG: tRNA (adenosine(37)-N6)-threonylcarbamoyltransferase complex dimerization subunit type 1 TsaB [Gemmatimonadaceae bacterium]|nr:tRNA (adenosine(37)-N6)-threonylcarbamoyltransferase complex dimerization subunit type 1 TsaB [Gemmatimonadaceae bacterium]